MKVTSKDCQSCGACCGPLYDDETHADLTEEDVGRLSKGYVKRWVVYVLDQYPALKTKRTAHSGVVCGALQGQVGKKVRCSIYENRPTVCRRYRPGSPDCLASRRSLKDSR